MKVEDTVAKNCKIHVINSESEQEDDDELKTEGGYSPAPEQNLIQLQTTNTPFFQENASLRPVDNDPIELVERANLELLNEFHQLLPAQE